MPMIATFLVLLAAPAVGLQSYQRNVAKNSKSSSKKNILFLMTDSLDGRMVDPESTEARGVTLPFLRDFFTANGANFVKSYSHNPMCVPSRTSTMTGRTSAQLGVWGNSGGLAASPSGVLDDQCIESLGSDGCKEFAEEQGYPEHIFYTLQHLGYNVHFDGRCHLGAALLNEENHSDKVDGQQEYKPFDGMRTGEYLRAANIHLNVTKNYMEVNMTKGDTASIYADWEAAGSCIDFVNQLPSPSDATNPFFLHCSLNLPHYYFSTNATWLESVHDEYIELPTWKEGFPESYHPYDAYMTYATGMERDVNSSEQMDLYRTYYAMIAEADAILSSIWDAITAKGYGIDDTYVVHISDHGELRSEHRIMYKASMYEGSTRIPITIAGPGIEAKRVDTHITSLLDIFPTILDMAGQDDWDKYSFLAGKSLLLAAGGESVAPEGMALAADEDDRDLVVSNYNWVEGNTGAYMARSGNWKLIVYGKTYKTYENFSSQLFNMSRDPQELDNVADEHPNVVAELEERLREAIDIDAVDKQTMEDVFHAIYRDLDGDLSFDNLGGVDDTEENRDKWEKWVTEATEKFGTTDM